MGELRACSNGPFYSVSKAGEQSDFVHNLFVSALRVFLYTWVNNVHVEMDHVSPRLENILQTTPIP